MHRVGRMAKGLKFAVCLDGANACPPEDVGGSWGYEHLVTVLSDPLHEEHENLSQWVGGPVDPAAFVLGRDHKTRPTRRTGAPASRVE